MNRYEILRMLSAIGEVHEGDYHDGVHGWFGWSVKFANGSAVINVRFEDAETGETSEFEWDLNAREVK